MKLSDIEPYAEMVHAERLRAERAETSLRWYEAKFARLLAMADAWELNADTAPNTAAAKFFAEAVRITLDKETRP